MKKFIATLLAVIMVIGLVACGGSGGGATTAAGGGETTAAGGGGSETPAATETGRYPSFKVAVAMDPANLNPTNSTMQFMKLCSIMMMTTTLFLQSENPSPRSILFIIR